jgi:YidC/Oxa1 family membrane protein insertase
MFIFDWIGKLFGYPLEFFYNVFFHNFGISLILFTIFTRILLFPLTVYQQKTSAQTARIQPKLRAINEKYKGDREKQAAETQKLYEKEGVSQFSSCLPMLIQMPIMLSLYRAIIQPLSTTFHMSIVPKLTEVFSKIPVGRLPELSNLKNTYPEIQLVEKLKNIDINSFLSYANIYGVDFSSAERLELDKAFDFSNGFQFLGLDLLKIPSFSPINWNIILVVLVFAASVLSFNMTNKINNLQNGGQSMPGCNTNVMSYGMSAMFSFFALSVPSALALYWTVSSAVSPLQSFVVQKYYNANLLNSKDEARRVAKLRIDEAAVIDEITRRKGIKKIKPIALTEAEEAALKPALPERKPSSNKKKKKK